MAPSSDSRKLVRGAALALLVFLAAANLYRAATQSITADEAFTYNHYAGGDVPLRVYDANHHVLFSWLARASVAVFGLSELSLRLPSVLAGCAYLLAVFRLTSELFRPAWLFLLAVAALTLNPFLLDFLSAARGYSLGLALWMWALVLLHRASQQPSPAPWRVRLASVLLGLAVTANLNFAIPAAALAASFGAMALVGSSAPRQRLLWLARCLAAPGLLLAIALLAWPLRTASRANFYYGAETLRRTFDSLRFYSFWFDYAGRGSPSLLQRLLFHGAPWITGVALACCLGVAARRLLRRQVPSEHTERFLFLFGGTVPAALLLTALLRWALGLKYPLDRTALYWIPLLTLLVLTAISMLRPHRAASWLLGAPLAAFLGLAVLHYAASFQVRFYAQWQYDAATRRFVRRICELQAAARKPRVRIGATWLFEPSLNFYRQRYRLIWLEHVTRDGPRGDYDYYVLGEWSPDDWALLGERGLEVLERDPLSGAVLARPSPMVQSRP